MSETLLVSGSERQQFCTLVNDATTLSGCESPATQASR